MSQNLVNKEQVEDYYPLSPMQEGMLLESVYGGDPEIYVLQLSCCLRGNLDMALFEEAWQQVVQRHAVLRTFFLWEGLGKPVQVVKKTVRLRVTKLDWRKLEAGERQEQLRHFLESDRRSGFSLSRAPLMRLTLIQEEDDAHCLVWTHHHLLLDGWSLARVLDNVRTCYAKLRTRTPFREEPSPPYRNYVRWLHQQDLSQPRAFWSKLLKGFNKATPLAMGKSSGFTASPMPQYSRQSRTLCAEATDELHSIARECRITVNLLVQGAWAIVLGRYANQDDVVFGAVVSGRPSELTGITEMVGVFINTLPVRVLLPPQARVLDWLKLLQRQEAETLRHQHTPLVEVQSCSEVPKGSALFESILAFDNYPVYSSIGDYQWDIQIEDVQSVQRSNYPLAVVAIPGPSSLTLMASYDTRRFDEESIQHMLLRLEGLLSLLPVRLNSTLAQIQLLSNEERALLSRPSAVSDLEETFLF